MEKQFQVLKLGRSGAVQPTIKYLLSNPLNLIQQVTNISPPSPYDPMLFYDQTS